MAAAAAAGASVQVALVDHDAVAEPGGTERDEDGSLKRGDELLAQLEVNKAGDALFEIEIDELRQEAEPGGAAARAVTKRTARASTKARS